MSLNCFRVTGNRSFYARRQSDAQPELIKCAGGPVDVWLDATEHANFAKHWGDAALVRVDGAKRENGPVLSVPDTTSGDVDATESGEFEPVAEGEAPVPKRRGRPPIVR